VTRMNDPGRDRKILVAVCFAGSQFARAGHQQLATLVWAQGIRLPRIPRMPIGRRPHIGEYAPKTNAICDRSQARTRPNASQ
jgi:hypothetical protein